MREVECVLGPVASLLAWRAAMAGVIEAPGEADRHPDLQRCHASVRLVRRLPVIHELGNVPLDVIVGDSRSTHRIKTLDTIVLKGVLPSGSFKMLDEGVYLCSPELCFALLGRAASPVRLAELGCELCGTYSISHDQSGSFVNCPQLTTCAAIESYLEKLGPRHGRRVARQSLALVADGSDSPRETSMYLDLALPNRLGGYAIRKPLLNARLDISPRSQKSLGSGYIVVDELYTDEDGSPLAVGEYDSKEHHFYHSDADSRGGSIDIAKIISDDLRREIIRDEKLDIVTVRTEDTKDFERFDAKAMRLGRLAGCDPSPSKGKLETRRSERFYELFDTGKWRQEHHTLRVMAGYERLIVHQGAAASAKGQRSDPYQSHEGVRTTYGEICRWF